MSIDARVQDVIVRPDGSGKLVLVDRPVLSGNPGIAGQASLSFANAPADVRTLVGRDVWGGDSQIILGDCKIAERVGYTRVRFVVDSLNPAAR